MYAATRQTVRNAIDTLANEGLLRRAAGKVSLSREATSNGIRKYRGDHEWPYRDKAIRYAFQFFRNMDMKTTPIISKSRLLTGKDRM